LEHLTVRAVTRHLLAANIAKLPEQLRAPAQAVAYREG
jgi:hypothetical protein